ncbi:NAD(P)-dependent oxidoreductase [Rhodococcus sp. IEGM 1381]|uniref:NAD-dependent epimerase/dehydratase family protein n=1 Tax=Rhodococcus sp. IEGM 1381 TaxID=3047085 RepID=UPI0024B78EB2|nr:NAD(P)-dependent oxidoreductase [Rhodococcus sp. IEGM 1381]MDI9897400.1 NAD(P)-dependent oxidoreductase [Rhodococcus sp. IEGM 1381]
MRVLLTGDRGILGTVVRTELELRGHQVTGYDIASGDDIRDAAAVRAAASGHDAIVHLAGLPGDRDDPDQVMSINLVGTWNVLLAAESAGVERVVYCSSGKALGLLERDPDYLPVDDAHRGLPSKPYALSKWLAEEMCEAFTRESGISTICLRPVFVADAGAWASLVQATELPPAPGRAWHLATFVDVRDVATAFAAALECPDPGHVRLLLSSGEIGADRPTVELVAEHVPEVPWTRGEPSPASRESLIDASAARTVLGWVPQYGWADRGGQQIRENG